MPKTHRCTPATIAGRMRKANEFWASAEILETFIEDEDLADAYVTICVHAGIAAADVICCKRLGEHAQGEDHSEAIGHLARVSKPLSRDLGVLLEMKTRAGYSAYPIEAEGLKKAKRSAKRLVDAAVNATRS